MRVDMAMSSCAQHCARSLKHFMWRSRKFQPHPVDYYAFQSFTIKSVARFYIENFGCRATQADGAALERQFWNAAGARQGGSRRGIVVLNTCTVTAGADKMRAPRYGDYSG